MRPTTPPVFARGAAVLARCATVFALCVGLLALGGPAAVGSVLTMASDGPVSQQHVGTEHPSSADSSDSPETDSSVSRGPSIDQDDSKQATQDKAQTKVILAVIMLALGTLVFFGRKKRNKHKISKQR